MKRLYLDACCFNRPFDSQEQDRVRLESEAVMIIIGRAKQGRYQLLGSAVLRHEIDRTPDRERAFRVAQLTGFCRPVVPVGSRVIERARQLEQMGFKAYDAMHVASAESGRAQVFLTTDDALLRLAGKVAKQLRLSVRNPLAWLIEESMANE